MKMFAHHYSDTPHGESHGPISVSVMMSLLFIGAQWLFHVLVLVATPWRSVNTLYTDPRFLVISAVVTALLLVFLVVDLRRNRLEAHGAQRYQYLIFGVAGALLVSFLWFLLRLGSLPAS